MSTLTLFKEKQRQQKEKATAEQKANKEMWKGFHAEEKRLYEQFKEFIQPFCCETIKGYKIKVVFHDKKLEIELFIDGKLEFVFKADTEYHFCNCSECADGGYGHEGSYTHDVDCYKINKKGERNKDYFSYYGNTQQEIEESFVDAFERLINDYDSHIKYGRLDGDDN